MILVFLFACSKQAPSPKQEGEIYFPQGSKGSKWEYLIKITTPSGIKQGRLSINNEGEESMNGKTYNKQVSLMEGDKPEVSYYRRDRKGIYKVDLMNKNKPEYIITPFPMTVGKTWTAKNSGGQMVFTAEKIENIEYLGHTYKNCLKVTYRGDAITRSLEGYTYYAPNVGEVGTWLKIGDVTMQYALDRYTQ